MVVCAFASCCSAAPDHSQTSRGSIFTLLSWHSADGQWYFALREAEEFDARVKYDVRHRIIGLAALKKRLLQLPHGSGVFWSNARAHDFPYPSDHVVEEVKDFALLNGINLRLNPALE